MPFLPPRHLSRARLLAVLDAAGSTSLTLVSAGAGAGKTVLLTDWAERQATPVVWLALTPADNDPRRFWRLFLEGGRVAGQVYPPSAWANGRTVELLDSVLGRSPPSQPRLQVVLDDAHVLTDPQILDGLDRVVRRWSHRVRLLATARSDPLLPLHRYRLAGQVCEIRAADLAMTVPEARELLAGHGVSLPEEDLRTLVDRTEGWSAGLRLAALRMQGVGRPADFVALLATDQGSVGEYLTEEVLSVQPEPVRRLLVDTSFLDQVSGPLADAVTGAEDGAAVLADLARSNAFVIPLDAERTVFRYHQLFREMLRHLAARQPPDRLRARYLAAARWYREHDDLSSALRWTIRSRDPTSTRSLLVHAGLAEVFVSRQDIAVDELRGLGDVRPPPGASAPEVLETEVARWAVAALTADTGTAPAELERLPPAADLESAGADLRVTASLAELILGQKAGDVDRLDAAAERLLTAPELSAALGAVPGLRASVLLAQARSRFSAGRLPEVEPLLHRADLALQVEDAPAVELGVVSTLAFVGVSAGRRRQAEEALDRAAALLADHPELTRPVVLDLAVARHAEVAADLATMGAALARVLAAGPIYPDNGIAATVAFVQASYLVAVGDLPAARSLLRDNRALNSGTVGLLGILRDCALAEVEVRLGRPHSALRLLQRHRRPPFDVIAAVPAATAYLALGDVRRAEAAVRTVLSTPSPFVSLRLTVEALLVGAVIALREDAEAHAAELVDRALQMTDGELALPFVRSAETFGPLLARHPTLASRWPTAVSAPAPAPVPPPRTGDGELIDPLTSREHAVLRLMATSMSTADMAEELHLSVNTVKTHLASIYRKLGVGRRREAVLQARENELL